MKVLGSAVARERALANVPECCHAALKEIVDRILKQQYPLQPKSDALRAKAKECLIMATGKEVHNVVTLSVSRVREEKPAWMSDRIYRESFRQSVAFPLTHFLELQYEKDLRYRLGDRLYYDHLRSVLKSALFEGLAELLKSAFRGEEQIRGGVGCQVSRLACESVVSAAFFWSLAAKVENLEAYRRQTPLVGLLTEAIPLGELQDELGVWVLLVG